MKIQFLPIELSQLTDRVTTHINSLPTPLDTFFEGHIEEATLYRILINEVNAGYTSVHNGSLLTQFYLFDQFKCHGQIAFQRAKKLEKVRQALVPTCDTFFLSHALDEHRLLEMQAYTFQLFEEKGHEAIAKKYSFRQATIEDAELIQQESGTFFAPIEKSIYLGELWITYANSECAGFGIMVRSRFCQDRADIGMYTNGRFRNSGVGTATIRFLIEECQQNQLEVVAGCGYYNHLSKQTLEKAGLFSQTRLFRISY